MICQHCNSIRTSRGHYTRGWNNMCGQAAESSGWYCYRCSRITWEIPFEEFKAKLPEWCTAYNDKKHFPQFPHFTVAELLPLFDDGEERYNNDSLFHKSIDAIAHGQNPIALLDQVLKINSDIQKTLIQYVRSRNYTIINGG